jgi:hypothetical protein
MKQFRRFRQRAILAGHSFMFTRRRCTSLALYLLLGAGVSSTVLIQPPSSPAQNTPVTQRVIRGKVYGSGDTPQNGAVVYLKNMKSLEIKTYIAQDATYRFGQLGSSEDYELWAEFGGHKSKVKNISGFDTKKLFDVSLHIEDK